MTHARKRIRKLSTAVFRGARTEYSFDVFPISPSITDSAAVFIFSRRLVDKKGHAHHAVSCVGEAKSLVTEIKRHKRAKCVKEGAANVVCVLKEPDKESRVDVVQDISEARQFSCVEGKYKPRPKVPLAAKRSRPAKILAFKPSKSPVPNGATDAQPKRTEIRSKNGGNKRKPSSIEPAKGRRSKLGTSLHVERAPKTEVSEISRTTKRPSTPARRSRTKIAADLSGRMKRAA